MLDVLLKPLIMETQIAIWIGTILLGIIGYFLNGFFGAMKQLATDTKAINEKLNTSALSNAIQHEQIKAIDERLKALEKLVSNQNRINSGK